MLEISFDLDLKRLERELTDVANAQLPFAIALGLTRTAQDVQKNEMKRLPRVLDRPKPFTQRGVGVQRATKRRQVARVFYKDIQARYLEKQERGGVSRSQGGRQGVLIPVGARRNKFGNLPRGRVARLLARADVFRGTVKGIEGIWQRRPGGRLKLMVAIEQEVRYEPRLGFQRGASLTSANRFGINLGRAMREAIKSAR